MVRDNPGYLNSNLPSPIGIGATSMSIIGSQKRNMLGSSMNRKMAVNITPQMPLPIKFISQKDQEERQDKSHPAPHLNNSQINTSISPIVKSKDSKTCGSIQDQTTTIKSSSCIKGSDYLAALDMIDFKELSMLKEKKDKSKVHGSHKKNKKDKVL